MDNRMLRGPGDPVGILSIFLYIQPSVLEEEDNKHLNAAMSVPPPCVCVCVYVVCMCVDASFFLLSFSKPFINFEIII